MAGKQTSGTRHQTVRCPYCGEDYAISYKHCPFCDEIAEEEDYEYEEGGAPRSRGGRRLVTNTRGGGYGGRPSVGKIVGTIISLVLIVAAVIIVITQILPLLRRDSNDPPVTSPPVSTVEPSTSPAPTQPVDTVPPSTEPTTEPTPQGPSGTATTFTLNQTEFSITDRYPDPVALKATFVPAGASSTITWTSSNPDAVQVSEQGVVSAGSQKGSATITATLDNGYSQTCLVYNSMTTAQQPTQAPSGDSGNAGDSGSSTTALSLNRDDFTLEPGETFRMRVSGTTSTPSWSIKNTSVATVSSDGLVTNVGAGTTTLTCTVDGQTLTCIVRCN